MALPGVQVLFAFLLVVPFNQRFADITSFQLTVYFVTLLCATAACACLIAPTAHHRIEFREQDKERIVFGGNRLAIIGLTLLATAMTGAITLRHGLPLQLDHDSSRGRTRRTSLRHALVRDPATPARPEPLAATRRLARRRSASAPVRWRVRG